MSNSNPKCANCGETSNLRESLWMDDVRFPSDPICEDREACYARMRAQYTVEASEPQDPAAYARHLNNSADL